ncbi:MAG: peptide chain release factor N(5)-glutamine methyltransferase [Planctomycetota bacterium]|jgi:release factor glutamine methyltransferase
MSSAGQGIRGRPGAEAWTTRRLLTWMTGHFEARSIDSPRVVAEMLLAHVIGCERMRLYMEVDRPASPLQLASLRELVARAAKHEPVQYLVGSAWFFGRQFAVDRSVFIPRPCTEVLLEHVLQWQRAAPGRANPLIADIGTGSGCIAVSLAAQLRDAHVVASDICPEALAVAGANARRHGVEGRVELRLGTGLEPLRAGPGHGRFDAVCSNPPYVCDDQWEEVGPNVRRYEPPTALRGGADGLDVIRPLVAGAGAFLRPGGKLVLEIAHGQREAVLGLVEATSELADSVISKDHEGYWRMLVAERKRGVSD